MEATMTKHLGTVPIGHGLEKMWQLSSDGSSVRLSLPGLPVEGARQPVHINIEFDASVVGLIIDRLRMLRAQMKPPPPDAGKLN
jgi:hypothetical protein